MNKVWKAVFISVGTTAVVGSICGIYEHQSNKKLRLENAHLRGENEELRKNSKVLLHELGKSNYNHGRTMSEKIYNKN